MHVGHGEMYVSDPRFGAHHDERRPDLARFVCEAIKCEAIKANAARAGPVRRV